MNIIKRIVVGNYEEISNLENILYHMENSGSYWVEDQEEYDRTKEELRRLRMGLPEIEEERECVPF